MRGTAKEERKYYERIAKKTERDQFINSLSIGLEKSFNLPSCIAKRNGCDNYVSGYREILFTYFYALSLYTKNALRE